MKHLRGIIPVIIIAVVIFMGAYQQGKVDAAASASTAKIAVVNVTKVLETCQKNKDWQTKMQAERTQMEGKFNTMKAELQEIQKNMSTRSPGSADYNNFQNSFLEKQAMIEAQDSYYQNKVTLEMQSWTEKLYQDLLGVIKEVAEKKGLDMVIADEILDVPAPSLRDFLLTVKTKKLLYYGEQFDITEEVREALDKK